MAEKAPRVVAELGRPETPEETQARKAENSRLHRVRQNTRNLVYSLLVCVALVIVIVALVPQAGPAPKADIDYRALASQSQAAVTQPLLAPAMPTTWKSNSAQLRTNDGITSWYVGFVLPGNAFLAYNEGIDANPTWLSDTLDSAHGSGTTSIGGRTWRIYDQRSQGQAAGNVAYALAIQIGSVDIAVYGTATVADTRALAAALADAATHAGLSGPDQVPSS